MKQLPFALVALPLLLLGGWALVWQTTAASPADIGDPLPRITCTALEENVSYNASIYAEGLNGADGLAFGPDGLLYAAEEKAGQVIQIDAGGQKTAVLTNLTNPEGIAFDTAGNLYVVEDTGNGRLLQRTPSGTVTTLASTLRAPEGVAIGPDGRAYVTESELELLPPNPGQDDILNMRSHVTAVDTTAPFTLTRLLTTTPTLLDNIPPEIVGTFNSFAGITTGADGLLYVTNELSGLEIMTTTSIIVPPLPNPIDVTLIFTSTASVFSVDPTAALNTPPTEIAAGLITPEGLRFTPTDFPLVVAEEDTSGAEQLRQGRLSWVAANGTRTTFCTGFENIEDVARDESGNFYVSEDGSGFIIQLTRTEDPIETETPTPTHTATPTQTSTPTVSPTPTGTGTPMPEDDTAVYLPYIQKP